MQKPTTKKERIVAPEVRFTRGRAAKKVALDGEDQKNKTKKRNKGEGEGGEPTEF